MVATHKRLRFKDCFQKKKNQQFKDYLWWPSTSHQTVVGLNLIKNIFLAYIM